MSADTLSRYDLLRQYVGEEAAKTALMEDDTNDLLHAILLEQRAQRGVDQATRIERGTEGDAGQVEGEAIQYTDRTVGSDGLLIDLNETYSEWDIIITNAANITVKWRDDPKEDKDKYYGNASSNPSSAGGIPIETSYLLIEEASDSNNTPTVTVKGRQ